MAVADRNHKFATVLGGRSRDRDAALEPSAHATVAAAGARPSAAALDAVTGELPRPASAVQAPHRLLLSDYPGNDHVWLRIDGGRFAGTEVRLSLSGSRVDVCVLTPHEASRQTLAIAMEAVRNRLRARGLTMVEAAPSPARRSPRTSGSPGHTRGDTVIGAGHDHGHSSV
jgi:hypothetical protein